jgi:Type II secretion system (T2SS), protein M
MNEAVKTSMQKGMIAFQKLSGRERWLIVGGVITLVGMGIYTFLVTPVQEAFTRQARARAELEKSLEVVPDMIGRYAKLVRHRQEIESFYEKLGLQKPPLTHLEDLLRSTAKIAPGSYTVTTRNQPDFAGKYKHLSYAVRFDTTSLENATSFLRELVKGDQPMLLSQLTIERKLSSDSISVQVEVSSFERIT